MDELLIGLALLAVAVVLLSPILIVVLFIKLNRLRDEVARLRRDMALLRNARPSAPPAAAQTDVQDADTARGPVEAEVPEDLPSDTPPEPAPVPARADPPAAAVVAARMAQEEPKGPSALARLFAWLQTHWFYAASGLSLALAGLFLVQYGIENGYLTPTMRVLGALGLGGALIGAGEWIRRRFGDEPDADTAYLPSVFSGAGLVSIFGGILAARHLYGLIGPEMALIGMAATALLGIGLGWRHGPLLAAIGLLGGFGAPIVVGGSSDELGWIFGYFALLALFGFGIDTFRRWAWISLLTLGLSLGAGWLLALGPIDVWLDLALYTVAIAVMAVLIPTRGLIPDHAGPGWTDFVVRREMPGFPTLLATLGILGATASLGLIWMIAPAQFWALIVLFLLLALACISWSRSAPALQELVVLPAGGLIALAVGEALLGGRIVREFANRYAETPEADYPWAATLLVLAGLAISAAAMRRSFGPGLVNFWAILGAVFAPALAAGIELTWAPSEVIGAYSWALHAAVLAGFMVFCAERAMRADPPDNRLRTALCVLSALSCISFALFILLSEAALTAALAVTLVTAAWLDRRFNLPQMGIFIAVTLAVIAYRLFAVPGLGWALDGPLASVLLAFGAALVGQIIAWIILPNRAETRLLLSSGAFATGGALASILLHRALSGLIEETGAAHWEYGLHATIWFAVAIAQLETAGAGGILRYVRLGVAAIFGLLALSSILAALGPANPLLSDVYIPKVRGFPLFNTLAVAYLIPALLLVFGAQRLQDPARKFTFVAGLGLFAFWSFAALRHLWQGADTLSLDHGFKQAELWSYSLALLVLGAGLFVRALQRGNTLLRRAGLIVIGLAVAKVFFIDISGLTGLTRVFSLLMLGLGLAALAWLDRWAQSRAGGAASTEA